MNSDPRISIHHIGGRSGGGAFPKLKLFKKDIVNVLYDADADCIEQVKGHASQESESHIFPFCVSGSTGGRTFNLNYDPYTSSLLDLDERYGSFYYFTGDHDYVFSETIKSMEKRPVETVTLDSVYSRQDTKIPAPDILSLDTQGSEYEILEGAGKILNDHVVAVIAEAEFVTIYKNQKLFGDLAALLSSFGFEFCRFLRLHEWAPLRAPLGLRGNGFHGACDALFLRKPETIQQPEDTRTRMVEKLAFTSILFGQVEFAIRCLQTVPQSRANGTRDSAGAPNDGVTYRQFLSEFWAAAQRVPQSYPTSFASKYTFAESKARFDPVRATSFEKFKGTLRKHPGIHALLKRARPYLRATRHLQVAWLGWSEVERVFRRYDLKRQARLLRKHRIIQG